jgi:hypothetical protein
MKKIMGLLKGHKTNLSAITIVIVSILFGFKVIDQTTFEKAIAIIGSLGLYGIHDAIVRKKEPEL